VPVSANVVGLAIDAAYYFQLVAQNTVGISQGSILSFNTQFIQQGGKLVGTDAVGGAHVGTSVALSADGNTAIMGGPDDNNGVGAAWVFTRSGGMWDQQGGKLVASDAVGAARQGSSVALSADGHTAIVGGPDDNGSAGAAWVYTRSGSGWTQQGSKLVGLGVAGPLGAEQGSSVALSADGNTALVGGPYDGATSVLFLRSVNYFSAGAAWVFTRSAGVWSQQGSKLVGTGALQGESGVRQGASVALSADANTAIVGGPGDHGNDDLFPGIFLDGIGAAWVFTRSGDLWTQQGSKLVGTGVAGSDVRQGTSVALSGDANTAIVGGPGDNGSAGAAWVFTQAEGTWTQRGSKLVGTDAAWYAVQGSSVALATDGNTAVVGGPDDNGSAGAAWLYAPHTAGVWTQQVSKLVGVGADNSPGGAEQGSSVALSADGATVIVGGPGDNSGVGAAWVFAVPQEHPLRSRRP